MKFSFLLLKLHFINLSDVISLKEYFWCNVSIWFSRYRNYNDLIIQNRYIYNLWHFYKQHFNILKISINFYGLITYIFLLFKEPFWFNVVSHIRNFVLVLPNFLEKSFNTSVHISNEVKRRNGYHLITFQFCHAKIFLSNRYSMQTFFWKCHFYHFYLMSFHALCTKIQLCMKIMSKDICYLWKERYYKCVGPSFRISDIFVD